LLGGPPAFWKFVADCESDMTASMAIVTGDCHWRLVRQRQCVVQFEGWLIEVEIRLRANAHRPGEGRQFRRLGKMSQYELLKTG
jgi:hypothetical protein